MNILSKFLIIIEILLKKIDERTFYAENYLLNLQLINYQCFLDLNFFM
jgi:hypothetical protein